MMEYLNHSYFISPGAEKCTDLEGCLAYLNI